MTSNTTKAGSSPATETAADLFDNWFDPIEAGLRDRVHEFLHAMFEGELDMALSRPRYARRGQPSSCDGQGAAGATGHRHGYRSRWLLGSFGQVAIAVPRARLAAEKCDIRQQIGFVANPHPDATGRMMRLSLTARTPGVTSATTRMALFSDAESTIPHSSTVPSCTMTLINDGLVHGSALSCASIFAGMGLSIAGMVTAAFG